ncbi:MAG: VOC family protein [Candidatus Melainabacteria bacterium]|nr:VOC family protein [Candidatus Melainabacteria bacterium]
MSQSTMSDTHKPVRVLEAAFVCYPIVQVPRARHFYETLFGLTPSHTVGDDTEAFIEYELGNATFVISNMGGGTPSTQGPSIAFEVEDFEQTIAALRQYPARFIVEPFETRVCFMALVEDPEGNGLIIHKRKPEHA